jgi:hypothetical protein
MCLIVLPIPLRLDDMQITQSQVIAIYLTIIKQRTEPMKCKGKGYSIICLCRDRLVVVVLLQPIHNLGTRREWDFGTRRLPF